jgi:hypothetical protein
MGIHTFSSRDFTREVSAAKRATADGAVFITDRGRPAFAQVRCWAAGQPSNPMFLSSISIRDGHLHLAGLVRNNLTFQIRPRPHGMAHKKCQLAKNRAASLERVKGFFDEWIELFRNLDSLCLNSE